jgi:hypothetical protein
VDSCEAGECISAPLDCDDGISCTLDYCDETGVCRHDSQTCTELSLTTSATCYRPGATVTVSVDLSGGPAPVVGGQFFLNYDSSKLTFISADPAPLVWTTEIHESVNSFSGTINYATGIALGGAGAMSGTMAVLTFTAATEICNSAGLVAFRPNVPPTSVADANDVTYTDGTNLTVHSLPAISIDGTAPTATAGAIAACYPSVAAANSAALAAVTNPIDNCDPAPTKTIQTSATESCSTLIVVRVSDACGNFTDYSYNTRVDGTSPIVTPPQDITVNAEAGICAASVAFSAAAIDNCDGATGVRFWIGTGNNRIEIFSPYQFSQGTTTVTVESSDSCGNTGIAGFNVTVSNSTNIFVDLQLGGAGFPASLTRCIIFELYDCPGNPTIIPQEVTFNTGLASNISLLAPCGAYTCIIARDPQHALRRMINPLPVQSGQYTASFTAAKSLVCGNLNDDEYIDIVDFAIIMNSFGSTVAPGNGQCSVPPYDADINGDGVVNSQDFTFVQINFFQVEETGCCPLQTLAAGMRGSITNAELKRRGLADLMVADLNHDGVVDQRDIAAFMNGAQPASVAKSATLSP